jgi:hypothetical protein
MMRQEEHLAVHDSVLHTLIPPLTAEGDSLVLDEKDLVRGREGLQVVRHQHHRARRQQTRDAALEDVARHLTLHGEGGYRAAKLGGHGSP